MKKIGIVYGGKSGEHEVSLLSAASVINEMRKLDVEIIPIAIDKQGQWYKNVLSEVFIEDSKSLQLLGKSAQLLPFPPQQLSFSKIDVIFPVLHGTSCEDGCIQGVFEMANIPYVGSGVLSSAICMDKDIAKRLVMAEGLETAQYQILRAKEYAQSKSKAIEAISKNFTYPLFVKPAALGSSVGIHKVMNESGLQRAIEDAFRFDRKILIEEFICGREIEISVLESLNVPSENFVSFPGEIGVDQTHAFYSYEAKYIDKAIARLEIPAKLDPHVVNKAQRIALQVFSCLECEGMARIDLFIESKTGRILFNEVNTIPGFTAISMYPKLCEYSGVSYTQLIQQLIELAESRYQQQQQLVTNYQ